MNRVVLMAMPALLLTLAVAATPAQAASSGTPHKGKIVFGKTYKHGKILHATSNIPKNKPFAWLAHFKGKAGKSKVTILLINTKGPGPHGPGTPPTLTMTVKVSKKSTSTHGSLSAKQLKKDKIKPAGYTLEYEVGTKILASGDVSILSCSSCSGPGGGY